MAQPLLACIIENGHFKHWVQQIAICTFLATFCDRSPYANRDQKRSICKFLHIGIWWPNPHMQTKIICKWVSDWTLPICIRGPCQSLYAYGNCKSLMPICTRGPAQSPYAYRDWRFCCCPFPICILALTKSPYAYGDHQMYMGIEYVTHPRMQMGIAICIQWYPSFIKIPVCIWGSPYAYSNSHLHKEIQHLPLPRLQMGIAIFIFESLFANRDSPYAN